MSVLAREFRAADSQNDDHRTARALLDIGSLLAERSDDRHQFRAFHSSRQQGEAADCIERTRKAE